MRRIILLGLTLASFVGCSLADALENAPCESDDDCTGSQACVRTQHQEVTQAPGWCRSDGKCAAGEQEGCLSAGGQCTSSFSTLYAVTHTPSGAVYCCETGGVSDPSVIPSSDGTSAQCVACPSDLCTEGSATEPCSEGDSRCTVVEGTCGCRVPADQIENSECDDDTTCGEGFVCVRTLEQAAEPDDNAGAQAQEPGSCRPTDMPECAGGLQVGCRSDNTLSCLSEHEYRCTADGRCYCCDDPDDPSGFSVRLYAESPGLDSAACIECPNDCDSPTPYACTMLEDPDCMMVSGQCGCSANS
jgi:hypothetical protein